MDIFDSLIQIRKDKKVSQVELAKSIGVTRTTLSRYESKQRVISLDLTKEYAEYFGYEIRLLKK